MSKFIQYLKSLIFMGIDTVYALMIMQKTHSSNSQITIFGSARLKKEDKDYKETYTFLDNLAKELISLNANKYNVSFATGGGGGIMEVGNKAASDNGIHSIAFGIKLPHEQSLNSHYSKGMGMIFRHFNTRKYWLTRPATAFIICKGGYGTLDELFEVMTLKQTGKIHQDVPIIIYDEKFYKEVLNLEPLLKEKMIDEADLDLIQYTNDPKEVANLILKSLNRSLAK